jgi:hypothetical protein
MLFAMTRNSSRVIGSVWVRFHHSSGVQDSATGPSLLYRILYKPIWRIRATTFGGVGSIGDR